MREQYLELGLFTWFSQQKPGLPFSGLLTFFPLQSSCLEKCNSNSASWSQKWEPGTTLEPQSEGVWGTSLQSGGSWSRLRGRRPESSLISPSPFSRPCSNLTKFTMKSTLWYFQGINYSAGLQQCWESSHLTGPGPITGFLLPWRPYTYIRSPSHRKADVPAINFKYSLSNIKW